MAFRISLDIGRTPSEVFAFVADVRNMPNWYEAVEEVTVQTPGPVGIGTRFHMVRSFPSGIAHNDVDVRSFQRDRAVTFTSVDGPTPFEYRYGFEPTSSGTRLTLDGQISGAGLLGLAGHPSD